MIPHEPTGRPRRADDAGRVHLKAFRKLEWLGLSRTAITDAGLEHLRAIKSLKSISLYALTVTKGGAVTLKKALPELPISGVDQ